MSVFFQPNQQKIIKEPPKAVENKSEQQAIEKRSIFSSSNKSPQLPAWADAVSKLML